MKRQVAVLLTLFVLLLTGCRGPAAEETSPRPDPAASGGQTDPAPTKKPEKPRKTKAPKPTPTPSPAPILTPEEAQTLAQNWCENNRDRFSNAEFYAADRALWFADYAPGVTELPFALGNVYFYEDATGTMPPEAVAAALSAAAALSPPTAVLSGEQMQAQLVKTATAEAPTRDALEARVASLAADIPALQDDMWSATYPPEQGETYVMMRRGTLYRLQSDTAFGSYAVSPQVQVRLDYRRAEEAYAWFTAITMPLSAADTKVYNGATYQRVDYPGIASLADLRYYLKDLFSDEIVDELLPAGQTHYMDFDGVLYSFDAGRGAQVVQAAYQVLPVNEARLIYRVEADYYTVGEPPVFDGHKTFDFPYERVGDKWVFTDFNLVW
ncbi:MAG: hypothetical protein RRY53_02605 [Pseudoflavonifractor sp.]